jgi:hypothetical protein
LKKYTIEFILGKKIKFLPFLEKGQPPSTAVGTKGSQKPATQ